MARRLPPRSSTASSYMADQITGVSPRGPTCAT
jgi:hypothetical protein